ncbi:MAG: hypothetical protein U0R71_03535 [Solirubrobacterales bacterium]
MEPGKEATNRPAPPSAVRVRAQHLGWSVQERALWPLGDAFRGLIELIRAGGDFGRWEVERTYWALEDRVPALAGRGRLAATGAAVVLAAVLAVTVLALAGSGGSGQRTAQRVAVVEAPAPAPVQSEPAPRPKPEPAVPTLHGATPSFKPQPKPTEKPAATGDAAKGAKGADNGAEEATTSTTSSAASAKISSEPSASTSSLGAPTTADGPEAEAELIPGRPAGPKAIAVARRFSQAFVVYETGGEESQVREAFATTTTPALSKALLRRPPRLPANVKVPKAKVVTVVPGPSREGVYTLSVSLLRVGVTSELRLEMERLKDKGWRVTNVLG